MGLRAPFVLAAQVAAAAAFRSARASAFCLQWSAPPRTDEGKAAGREAKLVEQRAQHLSEVLSPPAEDAVADPGCCCGSSGALSRQACGPAVAAEAACRVEVAAGASRLFGLAHGTLVPVAAAVKVARAEAVMLLPAAAAGTAT